MKNLMGQVCFMDSPSISTLEGNVEYDYVPITFTRGSVLRKVASYIERQAKSICSIHNEQSLTILDFKEILPHQTKPENAVYSRIVLCTYLTYTNFRT